MSGTLHPKIKDFLDDLEQQGTPDVADLSVDGVRELNARLMTVEQPDRDAVDRVRELSIPGPARSIPLRVYEPDTAGPRPVFVHTHGGGWVCGLTDGHDQLCRAIANAGACTVVSLAYRLAPTCPFPAALQDCWAATNWVSAHSDLLHADPGRLVVGGGSAGGNLAAAVALRARDTEDLSIRHQFLLYPPLDRDFTTDSYETYAEGYYLTRRGMRWFWNQYLETPIDAYNPYATPLQARSVAGLPPATIVTAGFDPLRDEAAAYADRLSAAGVPVEYRCYESMVHGFATMLADPELETAREELTQIGDTIRGF